MKLLSFQGRAGRGTVLVTFLLCYLSTFVAALPLAQGLLDLAVPFPSNVGTRFACAPCTCRWRAHGVSLAIGIVMLLVIVIAGSGGLGAAAPRCRPHRLRRPAPPSARGHRSGPRLARPAPRYGGPPVDRHSGGPARRARAQRLARISESWRCPSDDTLFTDRPRLRRVSGQPLRRPGGRALSGRSPPNFRLGEDLQQSVVGRRGLLHEPAFRSRPEKGADPRSLHRRCRGRARCALPAAVRAQDAKRPDLLGRRRRQAAGPFRGLRPERLLRASCRREPRARGDEEGRYDAGDDDGREGPAGRFLPVTRWLCGGVRRGRC